MSEDLGARVAAARAEAEARDARPSLESVALPPASDTLAVEAWDRPGSGGVNACFLDGDYPDGVVIPPVPSFTVTADSLRATDTSYTVVNPRVVYKSQTVAPSVPQLSTGASLYCKVRVDKDDVLHATLATNDASDTRSTDLFSTVVHVATITPDAVQQYHNGAIIVTGVGGGAAPDGVSLELRTDCSSDASADGGEDAEERKVLSIKGWYGSDPATCCSPSPYGTSLLKFLFASSGCEDGSPCGDPLIVGRNPADGSVVYIPIRTCVDDVDLSHPEPCPGVNSLADALTASSANEDVSVLVLSGQRCGVKKLALGRIAGGGGGGSVDVDDKSVEFKATAQGGAQKLQIKGWDDGTPVVSDVSLAGHIGGCSAGQSGDPLGQGKLLLRAGDGTLKYVSVGTLTSGSSSFTVVTDVRWDATNCRLVVNKTAFTVTGLGVTGSTAAPTSGNIETTPWTSETTVRPESGS